MLKGFTENGELKNVKVTDNGELVTKSEGTQNSKIENTEENPVPVRIIEGNGVEVVQTSDQEVVLNASVIMLSTEDHNVELNKKVTVISIANYSDTADITMSVGEKTYQIGANLAIDFPINAVIEKITLNSSAADTKIQLLVKGVENV